MSIMSQLHAELSEQANELGYETLEEACQDGYHAEFNTNPLTHEESATLVPDPVKEQEKAHEAWLKDKQHVLDELTDVINDGDLDWSEIVPKIEHAMEFVEGCHD